MIIIWSSSRAPRSVHVRSFVEIYYLNPLYLLCMCIIQLLIMIRSSFMIMLLISVVCQFCEKDFVSLGRHSWRCKKRVHQEYEALRNDNPVHRAPVTNSPQVIISSRPVLKCCCGKVCKGERGLKMHQRTCRLVHNLDTELQQDIVEQNDLELADVCEHDENTNDNPTTLFNSEIPVLKKGIRLPKSDSEWATANEFFKFCLQPITPQDLNGNIQQLNQTVYQYFSEHFGLNNNTADTSLVNKYKDNGIKELKRILKSLKSSNNNPNEIKYVSHLLREKLKSPSNNNSQCDSRLDECDTPHNIDHDKYIQKNFWSYVKNILNNNDSVLPSFNLNQCLEYFTKTLTAIYPNKLFHIPSWIPKLADPVIQFDLQPPTYRQVTNIIRRMKASGCPCPLDQISIICFKRCPFLRSYLTDLIQAVWSSGSIPSEWKKACTILIHKKGDTNTPSNFRPITLENIPLKVFTSCVRNAMYFFLTANSYIEQNIQKGFTPNISGTLEHTAQMTNIINKARNKQRSLVITLLDLKNAFGEVHHNLIQSVLDYHHIPDHIKLIINNLYTDFKTSIITSSFQTPFIPVGRGVLQGDCLSPLLFNMCFNTFIQHIKVEKYRQFGFSCKFINPIHWFQFADDAAVITSQESENQHLLNRFSVWCQWSNMFIRVEKCSTFGIKKAATKSIQYLPKLIINSAVIPTVKIGESFKYLGRYFNFNMSDDVHKFEISSLIEKLMSNIDSKPLHPKNKLLLYSRYVLSKLSWHFTVSNISQTWIKENIDSIANSYIRRWLEIPISGTLSSVFMNRNKFGLNICPPSIKFMQCQTVLRNALKNSPNAEINELWKTTSTNQNIQYDVYSTTKEVIKAFRSNQENKLQNKLSTQGSFFNSISKFALSQLTKL